MLAGKADVEESPLAGKSTLNRLELSDGTPSRYKKITFWKDALDESLVKVFVEAPEEIVLDVDATDFPLHGKQEGRSFHGYYDSYCYLPLYILCGGQILCARLRESNRDAAAGSLAEIQRIVAWIRAAWPQVRIIFRGDSGFCRDELMSWCEANRVDYVFGLPPQIPNRHILLETASDPRQFPQDLPRRAYHWCIVFSLPFRLAIRSGTPRGRWKCGYGLKYSA
jgi:hypothetical protein